MTVQPIPEGYRTVTPYLIVEGAESARQVRFRTWAGGVKSAALQSGIIKIC